MAVLKTDSDGRQYVLVEKGDNLWSISAKYYDGGSNYQKLAQINNHPNPSLIYAGQKFYLTKADSTAAAKAPSNPAQNSNGVTVSGPGLLTDSDDELFVSWTWPKESVTAKYKVVWKYQVENGNVYIGETKDISVDKDFYEGSRYTTYKIPTNAIEVRFMIKPISIEKTSTSLGSVSDGWKTPSASDISSWLGGTGSAGTSVSESKTTTTVEFEVGFTKEYKYKVTTLFETPSTPSIEIDKDNQLTARLDNLDTRAKEVMFEIIMNDTSSFAKSDWLSINEYNHVHWTCKVDAGNEYKVRCKYRKDKLESDWSQFSANEKSMPAPPDVVQQPKATGKNTDGYSVYLEWSEVKSAETYDIQYTTNKEYFDNIGGDPTIVSTTDDSTKTTIYKLQAGEYFFRIRAKRGDVTSDWSGIVSVKLGEPPDAPTTWSSTMTAIVGEPLSLYWQHNSADGSTETWAWLELSIGDSVETHEIPNDGYYEIDQNGIKHKVRDFEDDSEKNLTKFCVIDTNRFSDGVTLKWRVCTSGVTNQLGDWSVSREVNIYARPSLDLMVTDSFEIGEDGSITLNMPESGLMDTLYSFPFFVKAVAGPVTQTPVGYHMSVIANLAYDTVDTVGNNKSISSGEAVYSKYFDISTPLLVEFSPANIDLENNVSYTIKCTVAMNSGLTAEAAQSFIVSWTDTQYKPNAEVAIDYGTFTASIRPYCFDNKTAYYSVEKKSKEYSVTETMLDEMTLEDAYTQTGEKVSLGKNQNGSEIYYATAYVDRNGKAIEPTTYKVNYSNGVYTLTTSKVNIGTISSVYTTTGEHVLLGVIDGSAIYYCEKDSTDIVDDVTLAVYRREFDGGFTELAKNLVNSENTFISDPHPALDYARYRVVATAKSNGAVSYYDLPGHPVGGVAIVIQWDEEWSTFNGWNEDPLAEPAWHGSMLLLPYNIDVSDSNSSDVSHVKYIGRKRPVAYYGTQLGETATWNTTIPKDDEETLYGLRRLALWMGNVYVREPSGSGYWATVSVSFNQKHRDLTIPVTLSITRVEGGI